MIDYLQKIGNYTTTGLTVEEKKELERLRIEVKKYRELEAQESSKDPEALSVSSNDNSEDDLPDQDFDKKLQKRQQERRQTKRKRTYPQERHSQWIKKGGAEWTGF